MRKVVLTFGLLAGAVLSAVMLLTLPFHEAIGFDRSAIIGYTTMVLAFLMVYFGVRSYRDNVAGGTVTFGKALVVGLLIVLVASACYVATWEFIFYRLTPDFAEKYGAYVVEKLRASGASDAAIAAKVTEMQQFSQMYRNPLVNIAMTLLEPLPVGVLFSLISAWLLSRSRSPAASPGAAAPAAT